MGDQNQEMQRRIALLECALARRGETDRLLRLGVRAVGYGVAWLLVTAPFIATAVDLPTSQPSSGDPISAAAVWANFDTLADTVTMLEARVPPSGVIEAFAGPTDRVPAGWRICDGSAIDRDDAPELFAAIDVSWGDGRYNAEGQPSGFIEGEAFNLPDLRGRFLRGVDMGAGRDPDATARVASNVGGREGDDVASQQFDAFGSHRHGQTDLNVPMVSSDAAGAAVDGLGSSGSNSNNLQDMTEYVGGNETRPKNANVFYIIKD